MEHPVLCNISLTFALWMRAGISGPRAIPLALVLHRVDHAVVLQPKLLRRRTAVCDDVAVTESPGSGVIELYRLVQRGDFFVGEALDVVDAADDALNRGVGVGDSGKEGEGDSVLKCSNPL